MSLPAFTVGPPPQPQEVRFWEWITEFWRWVKKFWSASSTDLTSLEARVTALETDFEELMSDLVKTNEILADLLTEQRIATQYLYELPRQLNAGAPNPVTDEPAAFRSDQTAFIN